METEHKGRRADWGGHLALDTLTMVEIFSWRFSL